MTEPAPTLNPTALTPYDLARLLSAAGDTPVTVDVIDADIAGGAPTNGDGTLNVVHYGAWLLRGLEQGFEQIEQPVPATERETEETGAPGAGQMTFDWSRVDG